MSVYKYNPPPVNDDAKGGIETKRKWQYYDEPISTTRKSYSYYAERHPNRIVLYEVFHDGYEYWVAHGSMAEQLYDCVGERIAIFDRTGGRPMCIIYCKLLNQARLALRKKNLKYMLVPIEGSVKYWK